MSRPPKKAIEQIKRYCEKTQCRKCCYGIIERYRGECVSCRLQETSPVDWDNEGFTEAVEHE